MLSIVTLSLGLLQTNAYLIADDQTGDAAVIDPGGEGALILAEARKRGWRIAHIWLTHAHFDHIGGSAEVADGLEVPPPVALHPEDYPLWRMQGGAPLFGLDIDPGPEPTIDLFHGQLLRLGNVELMVLHTPGHTRGSVTFYCEQAGVAFVGDLIFQGSIGRTDLTGGDYAEEIKSIRENILTLPDPTRLFPGHGPDTTVGLEREYNPFLDQG
jgi:glyoxylase-like metal-dependent hydrolase (beta-lactamase superfamily II)